MSARYVPKLDIPASRREKPPQDEPRWIGKSMKRVEDPRLLTGKGKYLDDVVVPGMAHAAMLRSPFAHARIKSIDVSAARAEFVRSASRIDINDAVLWGQQVGFTIQGNVDYGRDRVDIGGTFVPGYAFNNAFAQVPVVGMILGGGQYGGLFAVNFRVSGSASQPTMTVNPLSAIAPGILRRFVDPLGGGPLEQSRPGGNLPAPGTPER